MQWRIVIIGLILSSASFALAENPHSQQARAIAKKIEHQLMMYHVDCNEFPTTEQGLSALVSPPKDGCKSWGPDSYLKTLPLDPWNRPWRYAEVDKNHFELLSLGADDAPGGIEDATDIKIEGKY